MVRPARVRRVRRAPPPRSPPMFWTLAPNAIRSNTAIATPTSPAQASTVVPARVSRTYFTEVPNANRLVRNTSDVSPSRSVARTGAGLGGEGRNKNGVAQERQAKTSRNDVALAYDHARRTRGTLSRDGPARRRHCIRMTFTRGTSEPRSAPPAVLLNNRPNCAAPPACRARKYSPEPARRLSLRSTALPAPTPGTSVSAEGIPVFGGDPVRA